MFSFAEYLDLPLVWSGLIAVAIFLYVLLDGFDLGIGVLFPFAPSDECRNKMMNSIAPFWDGNETWLILGGGGLLVAFPLAYSILLPAFYLPIILMLVGLIFRGVAFEFRFKAHGKSRFIWDYSFHFGSLLAAFMQGVILGSFVQGVEVKGRVFSGDHFAWLSAFSMMTGIAVIFGYALLGATWLIMKTEDITQDWSRRTSRYVLLYVLLFMGIVSLWVPFTHEMIKERWFSMPNFIYLSVIPIAVLVFSYKIYISVNKKCEIKPFLYSIGLFFLGYIGLAISIWPAIVPYKVTIWQAAAAPEALSLLLVGALILLPIILFYTGYCYYVFRGKASNKGHY